MTVATDGERPPMFRSMVQRAAPTELAIRDGDRLFRLFAAHPLVKVLSEQAQRRLLNRSHVRHLDEGDVVYEAGSPATEVYFILSGALQVEMPDLGETRGRVVSIYGAPSFLGECQVMHGRPWSGTGVALTPLIALGIARAQLEALVLEHPGFGLALYRDVTFRFLRAIDSWKTQPKRSPQEAVARYVLGVYRAVWRTGEDAPIRLAIRQADLGRAVGLRREVVNQVLKSFVAEGLVSVERTGLNNIREARLQALLPPETDVSEPLRLTRFLLGDEPSFEAVEG